MKLFLPLFLFITSMAWANGPSHQSLADLMELIRDPVFPAAKRKEMLDFVRKSMATKLSQEINVPESRLNQTFMYSPAKTALLLRDPWYDVQTQFYTTLHQENYHQRWIELQRLIKFSDYGKSIHETMMGYLGEFTPVIEGRYYARWNRVGIKTGGRTRYFNVPYFLMSGNIQDLIRMEAHVPFQEIFPERDKSPSLPSLQTFLKNTERMTRIKRQELAEKMELNRRIYIRAVANAAKTVASIHYLSGSLNRYMTERKVSSFMEGYCDGCTENEKKDYQTSAMNYVDHVKETMSVSSPSEVAKSFCTSLRKNGYQWNIDRLKPTPIEIIADQRKLANYYILHKLKGKNRDALAKTILDQDLGILFLTNAINVLDKSEEPVGTLLNCTNSSVTQDSQLVRKAIGEAEANIGAYITRVNHQLMNGRFNLANTDATLEYFVHTNQAASIEAVAHFPQGVGWVLKTIVKLDQDRSRRKKTDKIVYWGGTIIGVGLIISGVGAPEGVAVLGATINMLKAVGSGSYFFVRSFQEKQFAKDVRLAKSGSAELSEANVQDDFHSYKLLKAYYIKEFGFAAINFMRLHKVALKSTGGDVEKAHKVLNKVKKGVGKSGADEAMDELVERILQAAIGA